MMKRLIRIVALILVLVTVFMLPASAAEIDGGVDPFVDLLDYGYILNGTGYLSTSVPANGTFHYQLDTVMMLSYIDVTMSIKGVVPTAIKGTFGGSTFNLTLLNIGSDLYRAYGRAYSASGSGSISFKFTSTGISRVTICGFKASVGYYTSVAETGRIAYEDPATGIVYTSEMPSAGSKTSLILSYDPATDFSGYADTYVVDLYAYFDDWKLYDYGQMSLKITGLTAISSIAVQIGNTYVPFEMSYVFVDNGPDNYLNGSVYLDGEPHSGLVGNYTETSDVYLTIRADFTGLQRNLTDTPTVRIFGSQIKARSCVYTLLSYDGIVTQQGASWFQRLQFSLSNFFFTLSADISALGDRITDKLDAILGIGSEGDALTSGSQEIQDDVSQIEDFEQSQMDVMDSGMTTIQDTVNFTRFSTALSFVQNYLNMAFISLGDVTIIFALPLFLGLFFYVCSRVPGATRWKSPPPKGGKKS